MNILNYFIALLAICFLLISCQENYISKELASNTYQIPDKWQSRLNGADTIYLVDTLDLNKNLIQITAILLQKGDDASFVHNILVKGVKINDKDSFTVNFQPILNISEGNKLATRASFHIYTQKNKITSSEGVGRSVTVYSSGRIEM